MASIVYFHLLYWSITAACRCISFWNYKHLKGTNEVYRQYFQQAVLLCLLKALYHAGICSYAACIMLCPKLCGHNLPRPSAIIKKSCEDYLPHVFHVWIHQTCKLSRYLQESVFIVRCTHIDIQTYRHDNILHINVHCTCIDSPHLYWFGQRKLRQL